VEALKLFQQFQDLRPDRTRRPEKTRWLHRCAGPAEAEDPLKRNRRPRFKVAKVAAVVDWVVAKRHATPPFIYQDPLPLGPDETEYRLLSRDGITAGQFEARKS